MKHSAQHDSITVYESMDLLKMYLISANCETSLILNSHNILMFLFSFTFNPQNVIKIGYFIISVIRSKSIYCVV